MSGGLTENQVQLVRDSLSNMTTLRIFPDIVETTLFAIFTVLICVSTSILISKGLRNWSNRIMLAVTLFMYAASALIWAVNIKIMWNELNVLFPALLSPATHIGEDINSTLVALDGALVFTSDLFGQTNILLSDAVVLWRACVVWNRHRAVVSISVFIMTCILGLNIVYTLFDAVESIPSAPQSLLRLENSINVIVPLFYTLSAVANLWATGMVGYKAWSHRRDIRAYLQNRAAKSAVWNVLVLLVESGIIYSICLVMLMIMNFPFISPIANGVFNTYWGTIMNHISGMYPTLVIVIVALQKSHLEHQFSYVEKGPDATGMLPFSVRIPHSRISGGTSFPGTHPPFQLGTSRDAFDSSDSGGSSEVSPPQEKEHSGV